MDRQTKIKTLLAVAIALIACVFLFDPIAQDLLYHQFADRRNILGIPHMWNIISNLPFCFFGLYYLIKLSRNGKQIGYPEDRSIYYIFFVGFFLIGIASSYYHLNPSNQTLVWDRLSMTIAFMALFTFIISMHINQKMAHKLLWPLLIVGFISVLYWHYTESLGKGDLRPYAIVQFLPMILIPIILLTLPTKNYQSKFVFAMIGFYVIAKLAEHFDTEIHDSLNISGHSIKHIIASIPGIMFYQAIASIHKGGGISSSSN